MKILKINYQKKSKKQRANVEIQLTKQESIWMQVVKEETRRHRMMKKITAKQSMDYIEQIVLSVLEVTHDELCEKTNRRGITIHRQTVFYFLRNRTRATWVNIGGLYGLDHSTAIHGHRIITDLMVYDKELKKRINKINTKIAEANVTLNRRLEKQLFSYGDGQISGEILSEHRTLCATAKTVIRRAGVRDYIREGAESDN